MRRKYTLTRAVIVIVVCLTIFLAVLIDNSSVCTESCSVSLEDLTFPVRIILLSDLHGKSFGRENSRLIAKIEEQTPDVIFLDGDMIDRSADSADGQELL